LENLLYPAAGAMISGADVLSHHSVNENGDENGERLNAFTRNPLSSPFSFTDFPEKVPIHFRPAPRVVGYNLAIIGTLQEQDRLSFSFKRIRLRVATKKASKCNNT
jgi:hypothetical protein